MKLLLLLPLLLASPAIAAVPTASARWCQPLTWSAEKTASPSKADLDALRCLADGRSPDAGFALAMLIKVGRGLPADPGEARERLQKLAAGTRQDEARNRISATKAFDFTAVDQATRTPDIAPYPPAMRELAKMQLLGQGGPHDVVAAKRWLARAAETDREAKILLEALVAKGY